MTDFFSTGTARGARDKYEVCLGEDHLVHVSVKEEAATFFGNIQGQLTQSHPYLIFVTGTTGAARGEKICHVEKFQISIPEICGDI